MDPTLQAIVDFITRMLTDPPPDEVLDRCREILVDSLGCAIGGHDCIAAHAARSFPAVAAGEVGAVIGLAQGAPIDIAAFWNTAMIRNLDFTDSLSGGDPKKRFGFRVQEYGLRSVFKRVPDHPALAGLSSSHLAIGGAKRRCFRPG